MLHDWRLELAAFPETERAREMARRAETYADQLHGECLLKDPVLARLVQEGLFWGHRRMYELQSWVVMPNHVHALLVPNSGITLAEIVRRVKAGSAAKVNRVRGVRGPLWQPDYFDRLIRNTDHLERTCRYIEWNPVKSGLVEDPCLYPWSSANPDARHRLAHLDES